ncbi:MAG: prepilin-type N-terminal cleavage/methylation domain-containing protein [Phycisphaerae bacterium]|nr:prepilin-type N-terminal cleavage/methylation domain-containing protein [Phycisphaerae bacterium]
MRNKAFTLVEILIVVIILGILAAIVIPQFTKASEDARESALASDLQMIRSQLELYKVQHLENYPNGVGIAAWQVQLTGQTDNTGAAGTDFGPYMQSFPKNQFAPSGGTTQSDVAFSIDPLATAPPGDDTTGWWFNSVTGKFAPNDSKGDAANPHKSW